MHPDAGVAGFPCGAAQRGSKAPTGSASLRGEHGILGAKWESVEVSTLAYIVVSPAAAARFGAVGPLHNGELT